LRDNLSQQSSPNLEQKSFRPAAGVGPAPGDEPVTDGQVTQSLDDIQKPDILGALKRALGTAQAVPQGWRSQQFRPHTIHDLPEDAAGAEVRFNSANRAGGRAYPAGKTPLQVLAAGFLGHFVFKMLVKVMNPQFFHGQYEGSQLSAMSYLFNQYRVNIT
jgi:hypothetical protein